MASTGYEAARRLEGGEHKGGRMSKEAQQGHGHTHGRTAHNMSSSSLRKKSDLSLVSKVRCRFLRALLANLQEIFLGTKLFVLFPAVPLAVAASYFNFGRVILLFLLIDYRSLLLTQLMSFSRTGVAVRVEFAWPRSSR